MDLLSPKEGIELDLNDRSWRIYTEDVTALPQYISADAEVKNAYITQGCVVKQAACRIRPVHECHTAQALRSSTVC
ncbi:MAG: hypothetical protein ACLTSZ_07605 [Lachnospiraceae bacterium]